MGMCRPPEDPKMQKRPNNLRNTEDSLGAMEAEHLQHRAQVAVTR